MRVAAESRHRPHIPGARRGLVIDFGPVSGEATHKFVEFVARELKRLAARNKHHEYLLYASYRRGKCDSVSIRRKLRAVHRFVPVADLRNARRTARRSGSALGVIQSE